MSKPPRKKTSSEIETSVLAKSGRRCALCVSLKGDLMEKHGQIAHLDEDRTNGAEDNLAFMCLIHHSLYDSKTKQHKNYSIHEVKAARSRLYELVADGKHLVPSSAQPYLQAAPVNNASSNRKNEIDRKTLEELQSLLPEQDGISRLRHGQFWPKFNWTLDSVLLTYLQR